MDARSIKLRKKIIDTVRQSNRGHLASAFSVLEIVRVFYDDILKYDPKKPSIPDRDRFILSKGHGCLAQYALLSEKGFFSEEELFSFCSFNSILGGHPEHRVPGIEWSTGSLGHGLSVGIGFAINAKFEKKKYQTFVVLGDGECDEGSIWEALMCAGKHKLDNLTVLIDYNKVQSYGTVKEVQELEPLADKLTSFGCAVSEVDGHDVVALKEILRKIPFKKGYPSAIICHTTKGKGFSFMENNLKWHHKSKLSEDELKMLYAELEK